MMNLTTEDEPIIGPGLGGLFEQAGYEVCARARNWCGRPDRLRRGRLV